MEIVQKQNFLKYGFGLKTLIKHYIKPCVVEGFQILDLDPHYKKNPHFKIKQTGPAA